MGFTNALAMFKPTMNSLFSYMFDSGIAVFLDETLVYSCIRKQYWCDYISIRSTVSLRSAASYTIVQCSSALMSHLQACKTVI